MDAQDLIDEFETLRKNRGTLDQHLTEIAERIWPNHANLFQSPPNHFNQGEKRTQEVYDSTGLIALQRFGAILDSLLTPRNSFWHSLKPDDAVLQRSKQVQDYFERVNQVLFEKRYAPRANFSSQNQLQYKSLGAYGTGAMFIDDEFGERGIRYKNVHLSELYMMQNHQGVVDKVCRYFVLTAKQAMDQWGDKVPDSIKSATDKTKQFEFLHWVKPRRDFDPTILTPQNLPFESKYVSMTEQKLLEESGYNTFPYAVSRYEQENNSAYGRSPAMDVLPAVKTLNEQKKTMLKQGHLAVDPVILANDDGVLDLYDATPGSMVPGGVNKDGRPLVQPMPFGRVDIGKDFMEEERAIINDSFLITLFQILVETPQATATEILERSREKGILLAPTIGRQQSEYLGPMIERELDILSRQGLLPEQPQILAEAAGEFRITYDSPITKTQKSEWAAGAMRTIEQAMNIATTTGDPAPLDYFNWDVIIPQTADIQGTPSTWIHGEDVVRERRAERARQAQQQQQLDALPAVAGLAKA